MGLTGEQAARICRGESPDVSIVRVAQVLEVVGLQLGAAAYPGSGPARDATHSALLDRFRARLPPDIGWHREAPIVAIPGALDRRAWDVLVTGHRWSVGVEAETHVRDAQAVERRINLKKRDGMVTCVVLLLSDTRWNRRLLRETPDLRLAFPIAARRALGDLRNGRPPAGDSVILL